LKRIGERNAIERQREKEVKCCWKIYLNSSTYIFYIKSLLI
jgi:hypothetical protein